MKQQIRTCAVALFAVIFGIQCAFAEAKFKCRYVDAASLTVINKAAETTQPWHRIEESKYEMPKRSREFLHHSTGIAIAFRTNSRAIHAHWINTSTRFGDNTTPILHSGLDLYIRENGEWVFAGVARPSTKGYNEHESTVVQNMEEGVKECLLYMPMFNEVEKLEIGIEYEANIEPMPSPFANRIMIVGSSITHGASAGRPGASYAARLGRALNAETPNVGLSGMCRLDNYFADIICNTKADAFILDAFSNSSAEEINERLYRFVERIRKTHPGRPIIFLQTLKRDIGHFNVGARRHNDAQRAAAESVMAKVCEDFVDVYFLNPGLYPGNDHEGTVDGTHLNDLGTHRTIELIVPKIKKILKKYGIK